MTGPVASLDDRAAVVALSGLPGIGPARLRAMLSDRAPAAVWAELAAGRLQVGDALAAACGRDPVDVLLRRWQAAARLVDVGAVWAQHRTASVRVLFPGDDEWPDALDGDPDPPAVLFVSGDLSLLGAAPTAGVVGTRRCSRYGLDVAQSLGADLASAGVRVVSGLAAGIDGAAHRGALDAGLAAPIGVVATGLDIVYPRGHRQLWREVAMAGVLVSEVPLGTAPTRWRFPARNRIIAALSGAIVVVESSTTGGAMHTVDEAARRDRPILAVPGPVTSRASTGTNRLLADGAMPACDVGDVLVALGLGGRPGGGATVARPPSGPAGSLLDAMGWKPATLDSLVLRTGLSLPTVARLAAELEVDGWLAVDGGWFERRR